MGGKVRYRPGYVCVILLLYFTLGTLYLILVLAKYAVGTGDDQPHPVAAFIRTGRGIVAGEFLKTKTRKGVTMFGHTTAVLGLEVPFDCHRPIYINRPLERKMRIGV